MIDNPENLHALVSGMKSISTFLVNDGVYAIILVFVFFFWFFASKEYKAAKRALASAGNGDDIHDSYIAECKLDCKIKRWFYQAVTILPILMLSLLFAREIYLLTTQHSTVITGKIVFDNYYPVTDDLAGTISKPAQITAEGKLDTYTWVADLNSYESSNEIFFYIILPVAETYRINSSIFKIALAPNPTTTNLASEGMPNYKNVGEKRPNTNLRRKIIRLHYNGSQNYCIKDSDSFIDIKACV